MIRGYVKIFLFLSSYTPLFAILAIKNYTCNYFVAAMATIIVISFLFLFLVLRKTSKMSGEFQEIRDMEDKSDKFLEYIIAYIIPFLGFSFDNIPDIVSLAIVFVIISILYIRSDLIYMNPILNFLGYNLFKANSNDSEFMIISKKDSQTTRKMKIYFVSKNVGVAKDVQE